MGMQERIDDEDLGIRLVTDPEERRQALIRAIELGFLVVADEVRTTDGNAG